jgi:general stress protein 26
MPNPTKKDIREFHQTFEKIPLANIATSSKKGKPHSATVLFVPGKDFELFFVTRSKTTKTANLNENPWLSVSIGNEPPMAFQMYGRATIIKDQKTQDKIMELWAKKASKLEAVWPPIFRLDQNPYVIYHFKPSKVTALDLREQNVAGGDTLFKKLR